MINKFILIATISSLILLSCVKEDSLEADNSELIKTENLNAVSSQTVQAENSLTEKIQKDEPLIALAIYKDPNCGCCTKWVDYLANKQFKTNAFNTNDLDSIKMKYGIDAKYQSCHTAISTDGYVFEGHIPAKFIRQFLKENPSDAIGLSVPSMPVGTPGMEVGNKFMPYKILKLMKNGDTQVYAEITNAAQQD